MDYGEDLALAAEDEWVERQTLPECGYCGAASSFLVDGVCEPCQAQREYDEHIDHLIDMEREGHE
ncbi:MAG TPA: hypothetical protein VJP59_05925 [Gemmatimonadota bacterium]|nr:hypothetical protein [Gemmatimonadota bacterium]